MFNFRIIDLPDGNQIIDKTLKTPYKSLTAVQMMEYIEMDNRLYAMESQEKRARREAEQQRRLLRNPLYRLGCIFGLI